jgi:hypothetical protein
MSDDLVASAKGQLEVLYFATTVSTKYWSDPAAPENPIAAIVFQVFKVCEIRKTKKRKSSLAKTRAIKKSNSAAQTVGSAFR